jgi:hypothetical protein
LPKFLIQHAKLAILALPIVHKVYFKNWLPLLLSASWYYKLITSKAHFSLIRASTGKNMRSLKSVLA